MGLNWICLYIFGEYVNERDKYELAECVEVIGNSERMLTPALPMIWFPGYFEKNWIRSIFTDPRKMSFEQDFVAYRLNLRSINRNKSMLNEAFHFGFLDLSLLLNDP